MGVLGFEMTFIPGGRFFGVLGNPGSGKTNLLAAIGYEAWNTEHAPIISNFHLNFPHIFMPYAEMREKLLSLEKLDPKFIGARLLWDEMSTGADAYDFMLDAPRRMAKIISQIRKAEMYCFYSEQRFGKVMKRLRDATDGFILMEDLDANQHNPKTEWHPLKRPEGRMCDGRYRRVFLDDVVNVIQADEWDGKPTRDLYRTHDFVAA